MKNPTYAGADWHTRHVKNWLEWLAPYQGQPCTALEIGSFEGRSALWLLENVLSHPDSRLISIDPHTLGGLGPGETQGRLNRAKELFLSNTEEARDSGKLIYHDSTSVDHLRRHPELQVDFCYVDGSHKPWNVLEDCLLSYWVVRKGGLLILDDYEWRPQAQDTPKPAIDAFLRCMAPSRVKLLHKGYQVLLRKLA